MQRRKRAREPLLNHGLARAAEGAGRASQGETRSRAAKMGGGEAEAGAQAGQHHTNERAARKKNSGPRRRLDPALAWDTPSFPTGPAKARLLTNVVLPRAAQQYDAVVLESHVDGWECNCPHAP